MGECPGERDGDQGRRPLTSTETRGAEFKDIHVAVLSLVTPSQTLLLCSNSEESGTLIGGHLSAGHRFLTSCDTGGEPGAQSWCWRGRRKGGGEQGWEGHSIPPLPLMPWVPRLSSLLSHR